jgi:glycerol-3-phosphate dehydrogenase (NAD(P)+)
VSRRAGTRAAVLGAGSWGTTFAKVLADAGCSVVLHARRFELAHAIGETRENPDYLPGIRLPDRLRATADAAEALVDADLVVLAVPSQSLRDNLTEWAPLLPPDAVLLSLMKGVELGTTKRMSQVIGEVTGAGPDRVAALSGPNLAREIAEEQPAATVVACADHDRAAQVQAACHTPYFRPYTNQDLVGCELGGAVKNVIALACGITEGMGFGDNTRASLITRGLAETARLGAVLGAEPATFAGLAGLGDLVLTCTGNLSRNRRTGLDLAAGKTLEQITGGTHFVSEGIRNSIAVARVAAARGVEMPITEQMVQVMYHGKNPRKACEDLMTRGLKSENEL